MTTTEMELEELRIKLREKQRSLNEAEKCLADAVREHESAVEALRKDQKLWEDGKGSRAEMQAQMELIAGESEKVKVCM